MSNFKDPLYVEIEQGEHAGRGMVLLIKKFQYEVGYLGSGDIIAVPSGFETDFCSIPRLLMPFFPVLGRAAKAAVVHDWLVSPKNPDRRPWAESASIFKEAMGVLGVPSVRRWLMWFGIRVYGYLKGRT